MTWCCLCDPTFCHVRRTPTCDGLTDGHMAMASTAGAWHRAVTRSSAIAEVPRDASCQLKSCQLPRNSAETTYTTSWRFSRRQCVIGNVHSTMTRPIRFHCPMGVINKPTTDELCISPVYRRLAVAKLSKSTM